MCTHSAESKIAIKEKEQRGPGRGLFPDAPVFIVERDRVVVEIYDWEILHATLMRHLCMHACSVKECQTPTNAEQMQVVVEVSADMRRR